MKIFIDKVNSVRNPIHVLDCAESGSEIAMIPYNVVMQMIKHPIADAGIEKFLKDYEGMNK